MRIRKRKQFNYQFYGEAWDLADLWSKKQVTTKVDCWIWERTGLTLKYKLQHTVLDQLRLQIREQMEKSR